MNIRDAQKLSDDIVAIIKEEKARQKISNYRLADMCNLSEAYLSYIFSYKRRPTFSFITFFIKKRSCLFDFVAKNIFS